MAASLMEKSCGTDMPLRQTKNRARAKRPKTRKKARYAFTTNRKNRARAKRPETRKKARFSGFSGESLKLVEIFQIFFHRFIFQYG